MDRVTEQAALLALLRDRRTGWAAAADAVEACGSAYDVLVGTAAGVQGDLFRSEPTELLEAARAAIEAWRKQGIQLTTLLDDDYPGQLLTVHQRPPFLFYKGTLDDVDARGIAVVGARRPSPDGARKAYEIAAGLAQQRVPVISGLASGIDTAAHRGAISAHGRTVAAIGTGIQRSYPPENAELQAELEKDHLVISQFWPHAGPTKASFPMRNAVMSGYAAATVVVEAAWRSGARIQARLALQHGRPVLLLRSLLEHDWAREYAAKPGSYVVDSTDDVLQRLQEIVDPVEELVWA
jgi:DNA processing protein